jgi:pyruvate kinase
MKKIRIICTLGPASFKKKVIFGLKKLGVDIFRINLSHTKVQNLPKILAFLQKLKLKKICIDTEGAQVRTISLKKNFFFKKHSSVKIFNKNVVNNLKQINFYPFIDFSRIKIGSKIFIGFSELSLLIKKNCGSYLVAEVITSGFLESNKGVHFEDKIVLNPLTSKDIKSIKIARAFNIKYFAMSFVNNANDVLLLRNLIGKSSILISKIETLNALKNLKDISKKSQALLIDRGDLSRYVPIENIPIIQEQIASFCRRKNIPLYVATNLLETMIKNNQPTRAESNDIYSSLKQGVDGLVLAAETAIGIDPENCVHFLKKCISAYKKTI